MDFLDNDYLPPDYSGLMKSYSYDLNFLADILTKLVSSYKLLISTAEESNRITLAKKGNVKDAIERAEEVGKIIDKILVVLKYQTDLYTDYTNSKGDFLNTNFSFNDIIRSEIDQFIKRKDESGE